MGFILPSPDSPREQVKSLMARKDALESQLETQSSILRGNSCTMNTPLVDADGFPRDDIDIYAVRGARVRIIELRNDLEAVMNDIGKALEAVYDVNLTTAASSSEASGSSTAEETAVASKPFARVDGVAPNSPAAEAGLQREDLVVKFGQLTFQSFSAASLQPLADVVAAHENRSIPIKVLRSDQAVFLSLTPRKGWGGRGMLGCHIIPYSPP